MEFFNYNSLKLVIYVMQIILWTKIGTVKAIVNGLKAAEGQFPYQVSVQANGFHVCGGAIISKNHILSAAHCIVNNDNYYNSVIFSIVAGILKVDALNDQPHKVTIKVNKIYIPSDFIYENANMVKDITVLKLRRPLILGSSHAINKVRLPIMSATNIATDSKYVDSVAYISGFGSDSIEISTNSLGRESKHLESTNQLKYSKSKVLSNIRCMLKAILFIKSSHICAQSQQPEPPSQSNRGVCLGDSGGPLVVDHDTIIGVLSVGPDDCNESALPAIYTRVTSFLPFIEKAMKDEISSDIRVIDKSQ